MKLTMPKKVLVKALNSIVSLTDSNSDRTILSNFILRASDNSEEGLVVLAATDSELSVHIAALTKVEQEGEICVNARKVLDVCRDFPGEDIKIESNEKQQVFFSSINANLRMNLVDVGLYPSLKRDDIATAFTMKAAELRRCIECTLFAVQPNEPRKNLVGVCLKLSRDGNIKWMATDGHRLSTITVQVENTNGEDKPQIIIPRKAIVEIQKILDDEAEIKVSFDDRRLRLTFGSIELDTLLVEGKFPDVESVIPKDNDKQAFVDSQMLNNALSMVAAVSSDRVRVAKLSFREGSLQVESEELENSHFQDQMKADFQGDPFEIGFNARYLQDVLKVLSEKRVQMSFKGPLSPCLVKGEGEDRFLSVVMPLRLEW